MDLFVYGTLCHPELLHLVLGHNRVKARPARLENARSAWVAGQSWPILIDGGDGADGLFLPDLGPEDVARLDYYEAGFGYALVPVTVQTADGPRAAQVYRTDPAHWPEGAKWNLTDWVARFWPVTQEAATEAMTLYGRIDAHELARRWPLIRARAGARVRARVEAGEGHARAKVDVAQRHRPYEGFYHIDEYGLSLPTETGQSPIMSRAVHIGYDAALVLPYDARRDRVLLLRQFRPGPFARGAEYPWLWEPVAGIVDGSETPEAAAVRESREEAGIEIRQLVFAGQGYASPGSSTDHHFLYVGLCDLPDDLPLRGGLEEEGEDLELALLSAKDFIARLDVGTYPVVPLQMLGHWFARHHEALRAKG